MWDIYIAGEWKTRVHYLGYMQHLLDTEDDILVEHKEAGEPALK